MNDTVNGSHIRTREQWLIILVDIFRDSFRELGAPLPVRVKVSCGWPSHGARSKKSLSVAGECWSTQLSSGGFTEIFVSPMIDDSIQAGAVLVHELVHAGVGLEAGHKGEFSRVAVGIGLIGPMRSTKPSPELTGRLQTIINDIGSYPHASLSPMTNGRKKQGTRMLKVICPECGYTVRTTAKWIEAGLPTCPCGTLMKVDDQVEGTDEAV